MNEIILTPKDYSKSIIYKIVCKDESVSFIYVGSTCNWIQRYSQHKSDCINVKSPRHKYKLYEFMRTNGGWGNFVMIQVEEFSCANKRDLEEREQYWKDTLESIENTYGTNRAFLSPEKRAEQNKKFYQEHKEEIKKQKREQYAIDKSYKQKYYKEHKDQILLKAKERYEASKLNKD